MLQRESCIIPTSAIHVLALSLYHKKKSEITLTLNSKHSTVPTTRRKINSVPAATHPLRDGICSIFSSLSPNVSQRIPSTFFCQSVLFCGLSSFFVSHWNQELFFLCLVLFIYVEQIILPVTCEQMDSSALCTLSFWTSQLKSPLAACHHKWWWKGDLPFHSLSYPLL